MATQNLYYRTCFDRPDLFQKALLGYFLAFSSWPRLLLEVFIRKNLGERYFSLSTAIMLIILLALLPMGAIFIPEQLSDEFVSLSSFNRWTWYLYLTTFFLVCLKRQAEIKRLPSVFDFARFTRSTGTIHPWFYSLNIGGKFADVRTIETWLEPGFFFLLGAILWILDQHIGLLFMVCSVFYAMSYRAQYYRGDHFVMDKIDEMICNEEMVAIFVEGRNSNETRGVPFYGRRPADSEARRKLVDSFMEEEIVEAM
ncbi:MAG: hypothetical protein EOO01_17630 [Chitinophagaceae bacterium]|nr:MAG: hypothetical protein EOO01_17630 [Chitinophagaceae bacterium]